jgi:hypothetical protein
MISRLKLKNTVDGDEAKETMGFYNIVLQQLEQLVNVTSDPRDIAVYFGQGTATNSKVVDNDNHVPNDTTFGYTGD